MYDKLDNALYKTRRRMIDVCHELDIDINDVNMEDMLNAQCVNCSIWGNKFTEMIYEDYDAYVCEFCNDMDLLRF